MLAFSLGAGPLACLWPGSAPGDPGVPAPAPIPLAKLVAEGDSITAAGGSYANRWAGDNPGVGFENFAESGGGIGQMTARLATVMAEEPSHMTILIGANDMMGPATAAAYVDNLLDYAAAAKAIRPALCVGVCGVLPRGEYPAFNTRRHEVNALLRAAVGSGIEFYVPLGDAFADPDAEDETLSGDGLHWHPLAYDRMEAVYAAAMDPILAGATGAVPSPFSFTDAVNAEAESEQTGEIAVTGMGMGATATATASGAGEFRRGRGEYGTTALTVTNGDLVGALAQASANPGAEVALTVTVGGVSDTFTVTTMDEEAAVSLTLGSSRSRFVNFSGSTYTFGADGDQLAFPVAGLAVVAIRLNTANSQITAVTIGGEAASKIVSAHDTHGGHDICLWAAQIATPGDRDVEVTADASINRLLVQSFVLEDAGEVVAAATKGSTWNTSHNVGALTVPANGLAVIVAETAGTGPATHFTWTNATEIFDMRGDGPNAHLSGATIVSSATPSAAFSGGGTTVMMCAAVWEPAS